MPNTGSGAAAGFSNSGVTGSFPHVYSVVRGLLGRTPSQTPDTDPVLVEQTLIVVMTMLGRLTCLGGNYEAITGLDKILFDGAAGRITAARMRPSLLAAGVLGGGAVIEERWGDDLRRYATPQAQTRQDPNAPPLEGGWVDEAETLVSELSCVKAEVLAANSGLRGFYAVEGAARPCLAQTGELGRYLRDYAAW